MYGTVARYLNDKGFGFIREDNGRTYFIHHSNLEGEYIAPGYYVSFRPFQNDRSDYNAKNIMVIEAPERKRKNGKAIRNMKELSKAIQPVLLQISFRNLREVLSSVFVKFNHVR